MQKTESNKSESFIINKSHLNVYRMYVSFKPDNSENSRFYQIQQ